jgi:hypothetical protein
MNPFRAVQTHPMRSSVTIPSSPTSPASPASLCAPCLTVDAKDGSAINGSRLSRRSRVAVSAMLALLGSATAMVGAPAASAAAAKPKAKGPTVVEANVCPKGVKTKVAVQKGSKVGDVIKIWEAADESVAPKWTMAVGDESHTRLVFSVVGEQAGWLQVNIPAKPNGSVGWVKSDDVTTYITPFYVLIELSKRRLTACNSGVVSLRALAPRTSASRPPAPSTSWTSCETPKSSRRAMDLSHLDSTALPKMRRSRNNSMTVASLSTAQPQRVSVPRFLTVASGSPTRPLPSWPKRCSWALQSKSFSRTIGARPVGMVELSV